MREFTEKVQPPRSVFLRWPFGHPLGEPGNIKQQHAIIMEALNALYTITTPGEIVDLPFRWRRHDYSTYEEPGSFMPLNQE